MEKDEKNATEKQLALAVKGRFVKGDPRIEEGRKKSSEVRKQRRKWREAKQFSAARKLYRTVELHDGFSLLLTKYETENDLIRAEKDIKTLLSTLANCTLYELAEILSDYRKE